MAILDIFKRKRIKKEEEGIKPEAKPEIIKKEAKTTTHPKEEKEAVAKIPKEKLGLAYRILKAPQVTEKATFLAGKNQYLFKVFPKANKTEIKRAIEDLYGVKVISVKIIKMPRKRRRLGRIRGWRKGYKKAIVKIKAGQKIEVLPR